MVPSFSFYPEGGGFHGTKGEKKMHSPLKFQWSFPSCIVKLSKILGKGVLIFVSFWLQHILYEKHAKKPNEIKVALVLHWLLNEI